MATLTGNSQRLAGYEVLSILGYGAKSTIYVVQDRKDNGIYALKRVVQETREDERFVDQVLTEYHVTSALDHPVLRKSYRLIRRRGLFRKPEVLLLMELVDGRGLDQRRPTRLVELLRVFRGVADGLCAMHAASYAHADLKPNNILINSKGAAKIIDFGQSCPIGTAKPRIQGTPDYIAPEQVQRHAITARTDVFNLAASLYWCLTTHHIPTLIPGGSGGTGNPDSDVGKPSRFNREIPPELDSLVLQCIRRDPEERPACMKDVRYRLDAVIDKLEGKGTQAEAS